MFVLLDSKNIAHFSFYSWEKAAVLFYISVCVEVKYFGLFFMQAFWSNVQSSNVSSSEIVMSITNFSMRKRVLLQICYCISFELGQNPFGLFFIVLYLFGRNWSNILILMQRSVFTNTIRQNCLLCLLAFMRTRLYCKGVFSHKNRLMRIWLNWCMPLSVNSTLSLPVPTV